MSDDLKRIEAKIDRLDERLDKVDVTLARNTDSLEAHMRRTTNIEERVAPIEKWRDSINAVASASMKLGAGLLTLALAAKSLGLL